MIWNKPSETFKPNNFKYVIVDTDVGCDDAQAIIVIDYITKKLGKYIVGITCVEGNC